MQIKAKCDTMNNISIIVVDSGKDIRETDFDNLASNMSSGQYYTSYAYFEAVLDIGKYTLVLSSQDDSIVPEYTMEINRIKDNSLNYELKMPLNATRLNFPELPYTELIKGEWTKENSKGTYRIITDNYQVFFKNPGYVLKVAEDTDFISCLKPVSKVNEGKDIPSTCIAIYEILPDYKFEMIYEDDSYAGRPWGYFSHKVTLKKNELGYLLLCVTFERGSIGPYELILNSSHKFFEIIDSKKYFEKRFSKHLLGNWTKMSAGGCSSEPTFALNPQYFLRINDEESEKVNGNSEKNEGDAILELISHNQYPVGIGLLEMETVKPIYELDAVEVSQMKSNASFLVELNTLQHKLKKGINYMVILATYTAGQLGYFDFKVDSDLPINLEEIKIKSYTQKVTLEGEFNAQNNKGPLEEDEFTIFLKNPSVFLQVNMMTDMRFHLYSKQDLCARLDLYEINESYEYINIGNSGTYSPLKMGVFIEYFLAFKTYKI